MLHIVKQFIFGLKLGIKSELLDGQQFQNTVDSLNDAETQDLAKNTLKEFFKELVNSKTVDAALSKDEVTSQEYHEKIDKLLGKLGLSTEGSDLEYDEISKKLTEYKFKSDTVVLEAKSNTAQLNSEIQKETVGEFNSPILEESAILEGLRKVDARGAHNSETIGTYLHEDEQKDIILKKDGKGEYYIELDGSTGAFKNDIQSETTNIKTVAEVKKLVEGLTDGSITTKPSNEKNSVTEKTNNVIDEKDNSTISTSETITERDDLNYNSLSKIISNMKFSEIQALQTFFEKNNRKAEWSEMRSLGYDPDGSFGNFEMEEIIDLVDSVVVNQEKLIKTTDYRERLKIIFDYNVDGKLDSENNFYTQEKEIFEKVETQEEFENILKNLGYTDIAQFNNEFNENYYTARNVFKTQLARSLHGEYVLDPGLMMKDPEAKAKLNQTLAVIDSEVNEELTMNAKVQQLSKKYPLLASQFQEKIKSTAKDAYLQSVGGVVGGSVGVAASFNVQEFTSDIIDTVSVGAVKGGVFGIQIGKEIYRSENGKTSVGIGLVNFIPYIGATHEFYEEKVSGLKELFQQTSDNGMKLTIGGVVSKPAGMVGVDYTKVDETTAEGISQMKDQMKGMLSGVLDNISDNEGFEETGLEDNRENRAAYDQLTALYQATGANNIAKQDILTGALNNYERELFNNAEGLNITGGTIGLVYALGLIPVIGIHGEYKDQNWEERRFVIKQIEDKSNFAIEKVNFTTIEKMDKLDASLAQFEKGFSGATRYNKEAKIFLEPTNTIADRWDAIKDLASYVNALEAVKLGEFLTSYDKGSDAEKLAIISTLGAWTRKSFDVQKSDTPAKLIKLDSDRRQPFNEMFGFDTSNYAKEYYDILGKEKELNSTTQYGTSFDAISTLNVGRGKDTESKSGTYKVSGIDMLHGSVDMIADKDDKPIQVEITNQDDKLAFAANVKKMAVNHGDALHALAAGIENGSIALYFYKDPDGFNDRILPVVKKSALLTADKSVRVNNPVNEMTPWSLFAIGEGKKEKEGKATTTPDAEETDLNAGGNGTPVNQGGGRGDVPVVSDNTPVTVIKTPNIKGDNMVAAGAASLTYGKEEMKKRDSDNKKNK